MPVGLNRPSSQFIPSTSPPGSVRRPMSFDGIVVIAVTDEAPRLLHPAHAGVPQPSPSPRPSRRAQPEDAPWDLPTVTAPLSRLSYNQPVQTENVPLQPGTRLGEVTHHFVKQ